MSAPIGVFIVSRNRLLSESLAAVLVHSDAVRVTGFAPEPTSLPEGSEVLLIDAVGGTGHADGRSGVLALLHDVRKRCRACRPILLGVALEDDRLIELIEAGAQGYVLQSTSPADLAELIRAIHDGDGGCSPRVAASVLARILELERGRKRTDRHALEPLTAREREVLSWIATGRCNKEIGQRLRISVRTVKNHVHSILAKLGARGRREALRTAYEHGLLGEPGESVRSYGG